MVVVQWVPSHNGQKGGHKVDMDLDHMEMFGRMGLVSKVDEGYVEEGVHRHMVVVEVGNRKRVHHIHWIGTHDGMVHNRPGEVVAMKVDHKNVAPSRIGFHSHNVNHH
ncbi:hypothetical protein PIB30_037706 [Stylosanthes scabra]|uniref:Uncharacterized protein n=1 Tax=Stylosanthes scabra TaxID=79078 RepID=A0ABU6YB59_9FABA|nr:hypothetical protein [Stylosanthes scabra]